MLLLVLAASECKHRQPTPSILPPAPDIYEPDNNTITARMIAVNGAAEYHNSFTQCDYDYVKFTAEAGKQYVIETFDLEAGSDTYMYLIGMDGESVIITDDDGSEAPRASRITWVCGISGIYYARVQQYNCMRIYGEGTGYQIKTGESTALTPTVSPQVTATLSGTITPTVTETPFVTPTATPTVTPMATAGAGLWHEISDYSPFVPAGHPAAGASAQLWWYGWDATGLYDTGAANMGEFFSGPFYVNPGDMLHFWSYEATENFAGYDTRRVYASDGMAGNWILIADLFGAEHLWYRADIAIPPQFAGQNVYFRFVFDTIDSFHNDFAGWFVDDISAGP